MVSIERNPLSQWTLSAIAGVSTEMIMMILQVAAKVTQNYVYQQLNNFQQEGENT